MQRQWRFLFLVTPYLSFCCDSNVYTVKHNQPHICCCYRYHVLPWLHINIWAFSQFNQQTNKIWDNNAQFSLQPAGHFADPLKGHLCLLSDAPRCTISAVRVDKLGWILQRLHIIFYFCIYWAPLPNDKASIDNTEQLHVMDGIEQMHTCMC